MAEFTTELHYEDSDTAYLRQRLDKAEEELFVAPTLAYRTYDEISWQPLPRDTSAASRLQRARYFRGWHMAMFLHDFTQLGAANTDTKLARIARVENDITEQLGVTEELLGLEEDEHAPLARVEYEVLHDERAKSDFEEIASAHARSLGPLARFVVARQAIVLFDERGRPTRPFSAEDRAQMTVEQRYFGRDYAHGYGQLAGDRLLIGNNAQHAIRAELIKGGLKSVMHAADWALRYENNLFASLYDSQRAETRQITAQAESITLGGWSQRNAVQSVRLLP